MPKKIPINEFLDLSVSLPVIDVRSPGEFEHGHIPGAHNIPLFSNEERAQIGTVYKQEGKETAIELGLKIVGPKLEDFVKDTKKLAPDKKVLVHCWRGGMRSGSFAWLLETAGFEEVYTLEKGYKAYRNHVLSVFEKPCNLLVLGGKTGCGKTHILIEIKRSGAQMIDLEKIARHKGSAFGALGEEKQPTQEQFENDLAFVLEKQRIENPIWIEDESRNIGSMKLPDAFYKQKLNSPLIFLDIPIEKRIENLVQDYGKYSVGELAGPLYKIERKLGGQHLKTALESLENGDLYKVAEIALQYYDKSYQYLMETRKKEKVFHFTPKSEKYKNIAKELIEFLKCLE